MQESDNDVVMMIGSIDVDEISATGHRAFDSIAIRVLEWGNSWEWILNVPRGETMNRTPRRPTRDSHAESVSADYLDLPTASGMLPYIRSIVSDVVDRSQTIAKLIPQQDLYDDARRSLNWECRQRRYAVTEEIEKAHESLATAIGELNALGVNLTDANSGAVEFPTKINNRPAFFAWKLGEESLQYWSYYDESKQRPIPGEWLNGGAMNRRRTEI
jgi:hypothetical protein